MNTLAIASHVPLCPALPVPESIKTEEFIFRVWYSAKTGQDQSCPRFVAVVEYNEEGRARA